MMFINLRPDFHIDCHFCGRRHSVATVCPELSMYLDLHEMPRANDPENPTP